LLLSAVTGVFLQVRSGGVGAGAEDGAGVVPAKGGSCGPGRPRAGGDSGSYGPVAATAGRVGLLLRAVGGSASSSERRAGRPPAPSGSGRVGLLLRAAAVAGGLASSSERRRLAAMGGRAAAAGGQAAARGEVSGCVEMARATWGAGGQPQKGLSKPTMAATALVD
jgi:hypothetical protein